MTDDILIETGADGIAVVMLNRPAERNAVSLAMWRSRSGSFPRWADVRVIVVYGPLDTGLPLRQRAAEITAGVEHAAASADDHEATTAFTKKRPARFQGR